MSRSYLSVGYGLCASGVSLSPQPNTPRRAHATPRLSVVSKQVFDGGFVSGPPCLGLGCVQRMQHSSPSPSKRPPQQTPALQPRGQSTASAIDRAPQCWPQTLLRSLSQGSGRDSSRGPRRPRRLFRSPSHLSRPQASDRTRRQSPALTGRRQSTAARQSTALLAVGRAIIERGISSRLGGRQPEESPGAPARAQACLGHTPPAAPATRGAPVVAAQRALSPSLAPS